MKVKRRDAKNTAVTIEYKCAQGVFKPTKTAKGEVASVIAYANALGINKTSFEDPSVTLALKDYLQKAEQLANVFLTRKNFSTDIPKKPPQLIAVDGHGWIDQSGCLTADEFVRLENEEPELRAAFEIKCALLFVRDFVSRDVDGSDLCIRSAIKIGIMMHQLSMQARHGAELDGKRKSEDARKKIMWSDAQRSEIRATFEKIRPNCSSDSQAWKKTAVALSSITSPKDNLPLTSSKVRHIVSLKK